MANIKSWKKVKAWLGRSSMGKQITALLGPQAAPQKWVFVLGCYNSGTTLLSTVLSRHPDVASLPTEGAFLTDGMQTPEACGWVRMWHKCLPQLEQTAQTDAAIAKRIQRSWGFWYDKRKPVFLEKSISNVVRVSFLEKYFQPAYFIYIVRNGYTVSEGIRRKSPVSKANTAITTERYPIELCAQQWVESDQYLQAHADKLQRLLVIQYEELVESPDKILAQVCDFIGISAEPLKDIQQQTLSVTGYNSTIQNMNASSLKRLSGEDIAKINAVAAERLAHYGYQVL